MKRKTETRESLDANAQPEKKRALSNETVKARFRDGLFDPAELEKYTKSYAESAPYVIENPIAVVLKGLYCIGCLTLFCYLPGISMVSSVP